MIPEKREENEVKPMISSIYCYVAYYQDQYSLNVRSETMKLLEKKHKGNTSQHWCWQ